jgi:hypothetical protein
MFVTTPSFRPVQMSIPCRLNELIGPRPIHSVLTEVSGWASSQEATYGKRPWREGVEAKNSCDEAFDLSVQFLHRKGL